MTLRDAQLKIQGYTNEYFLHLIGELSDASLFDEPKHFAEREKYRQIIDSIQLSQEFCQQVLPPKELTDLAHKKYSLINRLAQEIIQQNVFNLKFYSASNISKKKTLINTICQAHAKAANNHYPQQLLNELKRAASLKQIIFEEPPPSNQAILLILTRYKETLREGHSEIRDFFSNIVLSILHPLFVLPEWDRSYRPNSFGRLWANQKTQRRADLEFLPECEHSSP